MKTITPIMIGICIGLGLVYVFTFISDLRTTEIDNRNHLICLDHGGSYQKVNDTTFVCLNK